MATGTSEEKLLSFWGYQAHEYMVNGPPALCTTQPAEKITVSKFSRTHESIVHGFCLWRRIPAIENRWAKTSQGKNHQKAGAEPQKGDG